MNLHLQRIRILEQTTISYKLFFSQTSPNNEVQNVDSVSTCEKFGKLLARLVYETNTVRRSV